MIRPAPHQRRISRRRYRCYWPTRLRTAVLVMAHLGLIAGCTAANAQERVATIFNAQFLSMGGDQQSADLSLFAFGNRVLAGHYTVDVFLNGNSIEQSDILFKPIPEQADATPCLTSPLLDRWGVNTSAFAQMSAKTTSECIDLDHVIPEATATFDAAQQRLFLSVPQAALKRSARGIVAPSRWDRGVSAALFDYQLRLSRQEGPTYLRESTQAGPGKSFESASRSRAPDRDTFFGGLRTGFNIKDWRFRHFSTLNRDAFGRTRWQVVRTYVARDIASLQGRVLMGDGSTSGSIFEGVQFRGVQLTSDDAMLPDSQQGYAPTVRGVAQSNARVEVRQNGYLIYSAYVAPGPFVLDDLYPTSSSGDMEVTIVEADGRKRTHTQAFSAVPTLLRDGAWTYAATAGQYRDGYIHQIHVPRPYFFMGTLARGMGREITAYGGTILSRQYQSALIGFGTNLRTFGAVSFDLTHARSRDARRHYRGVSLRFLYAKTFANTSTSFRLAGYRYSSSGFRTFQESMLMQAWSGQAMPFQNRRNELRMEFAQRLGDWGSVYLSARQQDYWNTNARDRLIQLGYAGNCRTLGYNVYFNLNTNRNGRFDRQVVLTLSIPLGKTSASAQYTMTKDSDGRLTQQASLFGSAYDDYRLTYNISGNRSNVQGASTGSASLSYLSSVGRFDASRSQGHGYGVTRLGMAGGAVIYDGEVTFSQSLGETVALVRARKANGVGFESRSGIFTDASGNAVIPNLSPYRSNRLALRTADLGDTVEVKNAVVDLVPTRGAVVLAKFETSVGYRLMMTLSDRHGAPLPFGSRILNEKDQEVGIVGPDGQSFVTGADDAGKLRIKWGQARTDECTVSYVLPVQLHPTALRELNGHCE